LADTRNPPAAAPAKTTAPKAVKMHRAVHDLRTGPKPENMIEAGTIITDEVADEHKLNDKALEQLTDSGAVDLVEVLKG